MYRHLKSASTDRGWVPQVQRALDNQRRIQALLFEWEQETVKALFDPEED